jgi:hypothetical protein
MKLRHLVGTLHAASVDAWESSAHGVATGIIAYVPNESCNSCKLHIRH